MADDRHARMIADRLAKQKMNGASARYVDETSFVDWLEEPPEPQYWVQGVIPQGEQVVLYGKPEAGKTFLALDWSLSIATGRATFGHSATAGKVLYMSGEGNARITSRIHAWMQYHGTKVEPSKFSLTNHVPDLMNDQVIENLARKVADEEYDVVLIDTMGRAMSVGGGDISSPADAAIALKNLQIISKYRPQTTPIVLHHPIKDGSMAGAYNLLAGVDVALLAEVDDDTHEGTLTFAKNKDGRKGTVLSYRWKEQGKSAVLVPTSEYEAPQTDWAEDRDERVMYEDPFDDNF
jgi:RecA-family ATPase